MPPHTAQRRGLILPGGGARAAYQVGVLKAIAQLLPRRAPNPFPVISGTSAGGINAAVLAANAPAFAKGVRDLERVWGNFAADQVFRSDALTMLQSSLRWFSALVTGGLLVRAPRSLLDNRPLRKLLEERIDFDRIRTSIGDGYVEALAVTASGYTCARSVTFFQGKPTYSGWLRARREGRPGVITLDHLMATTAVPFIFEPQQVGNEYFGDGAMRQTRPLSAGIHLGAERLLVIGVRDEVSIQANRVAQPELPTFGQIAGYMLDTLFMDGLYADLESITRINHLVDQASSLREPVAHLKRVDCMVILPSEDIRDVAQRHAHELPKPVRLLLKGIGAMNKGGRQLISYLLFESGYTRELIELGYRDGMAVESHLRRFISGEPMEPLDAPPRVTEDLESTGEIPRPEFSA